MASQTSGRAVLAEERHGALHALPIDPFRERGIFLRSKRCGQLE